MQLLRILSIFNILNLRFFLIECFSTVFRSVNKLRCNILFCIKFKIQFPRLFKLPLFALFFFHFLLHLNYSLTYYFKCFAISFLLIESISSLEPANFFCILLFINLLLFIELLNLIFHFT